MIITGIYKITNLITNKVYIGSSKNLNKRYKEHFNSLKNNNHHSSKLQRSYNKYKENAFKFEILEECNIDKLIEREQYYMDNYKPFFNINPKASSCEGRVLTKNHKLKISNSNKNKIRSEELKLRWSNIKKENPNPELYKLIVEKAKEVNSIKVLKYNKNMEFIKEYSSMTEAARDINGDPSTISKVCKGKIKSHRNFIFKIKY